MNAARQTRYAVDDDGMVCLLLDVRGQARPNSLQIYSYSKGKVVDLPRKRRDGRDLIRIETLEAKRWAAVSVPRWLANAEGLHGKPELPAIVPGFCRQQTVDARTDQERRDDAERALAQYIVDQQNKYRRFPGKRWGFTQGEARSARIFE